MGNDWDAEREWVGDMIAEYGMKALLSRAGDVDRECTLCEAQYNPLSGKLAEQTDRQFFVSAVGLSGAPDQELDSIKLIDQDDYAIGVTTVLEELRITRRPTRVAPGGFLVFWKVSAR